MPNLSAATQEAIGVLRRARAELAASIEPIKEEIARIDKAVFDLSSGTQTALRPPPPRPPAKQLIAQSDVNPVLPAIGSKKDAVLKLIQNSGEPLHALTIINRLDVIGMASNGANPLKVLDNQIAALQKDGHPIVNLGKRTYAWQPKGTQAAT